MICKKNQVPPPIEIAFPETPTCKECVDQLNLLFTGCKNEEERLLRMETLVQLGKALK